MASRPRRPNDTGSSPSNRLSRTLAPPCCRSFARCASRKWHTQLLRAGGNGGRPLSSARTVGHARRILHAVLARAAKVEIVGRNAATVLRPPKVEAHEIQALSGAQISEVLARLDGHALRPIVALALGTGMRRGELRALRWSDADFDAPAVRVERSVEETAGLRVKAPKSRHGRRLITLPGSAVDASRVHRLRQSELRLALGMGRLGDGDLVFAMPNGAVRSPDNLSRDWRRAVIALTLPPVMFHALRHTHASALIAGRPGRADEQPPARARHTGLHAHGVRTSVRQHRRHRGPRDRHGNGRSIDPLGANRVPTPTLFLLRAVEHGRWSTFDRGAANP